MDRFPKTRYQGSKYKLLPWIKNSIKDLDFNTALDAFSGTASVSYLFKSLGKKIYSNDLMKCNQIIAKALIENNTEKLSQEDISFILSKDTSFNYNSFIADNFKDIYYTNEENVWLDTIVQNIIRMDNEYKKSLAFWSLFQSCLIKRPYNLFHRKNLHIRLADVERSFGNKATWDKPFEHFFNQFSQQINNAIFNNNNQNLSLCSDVFDLDLKPDLVYIDPPYIPQKGSLTMYNDFYHFLNGLSDYYNWSEKIDYNSKNLKIKSNYSIWEDKNNIINGFEKLLTKFKDSILIISYRADGVPSIDNIVSILENLNKNIKTETIDYKYVLSQSTSKEVLIIAK